VICSDHSIPMLERARAVAHARGAENVELRLLDAQRLELPARSVDGVVCRLGLQVMLDVPAALAEAYRVLRPGRRFALGVWSERERNPWQAVPEDVLGVPPPASGAPGPFALADVDLLRQRLTEAGFVAVSVERVRADQRYASPEEFWTLCMRKARRPREAFDRLGPALQVAAKKQILDLLAQHSLPEEEEFVIPAELLLAAGARRA
jgi:SAM-dependent methyltransferase